MTNRRKSAVPAVPADGQSALSVPLASVTVVPEGVQPAHWQALTTYAPWLTLSDSMLSIAFCHAWGEYEQARGVVNEQGMMVMSKTGMLVQNPYYIVAAQRRMDLLKMGRELGLSPLVRQQARR